MSSFDLYVPRASWLHRVDPRVKLLFIVEMTVLLLVLPNFPVTLGVLAACHVLLASACIPWTRIAGIWRLLLLLTLLIYAIAIILVPLYWPVEMLP